MFWRSTILSKKGAILRFSDRVLEYTCSIGLVTGFHNKLSQNGGIYLVDTASLATYADLFNSLGITKVA
jgi:hypothetical protein